MRSLWRQKLVRTSTHSFSFSVLSVALWLAFASLCLSQDSPAELANKLGNRSFAEREKAAKKLEELGAIALPALRASCLSADLETKRRAVVVMERIEDRAMQEAMVKPTPIHLRVEGRPLAEALH